MSDDVALAPPTDDATIEVATDLDAENSARAVRQYVLSQLSPRSRDNAIDALRRIARMVLGPGASAEAFPWPKISYELAMRLRRGLYDLTNEGRITPGTANLTLSHLRGIVRTMYGMGLVSDQQLAVAHPKMLKSIPGSRKVRGRMLSMLEEQDLRFAARSLNGYRGRMLDTAIVLAIGLGLRREEVASADLGGIRPGSLAIIGKGNRERQLVVDPQIEQALDQWLRERERLAPGHSKIFCSPWRPNFALSAWSFWTLVRAASHAAFGTRPQCEDGCECLDVVTGPHDFRRTFASRLLERGLDIREVQLLMGHESPETTARYDHRSEDALVKKRHGMRIVAELG